ncbi:MAG: transglycosylase domain-containing protein, partial [Thermodesulfobacteriota bacterium]
MKKRPKKRLVLGVAAAIILGCVAGFSAGLYLNLISDLPQVQMLATHVPPAVTRVYSGDGVLLARWFVERRDPVPLSRVPKMLVQALLATEDRTFYDHIGVDLKGLSRALYHDIRAGGFVQGGSTITQQLAKTLFLTPEKSVTRKLREALLALQIEKRYTKDE